MPGLQVLVSPVADRNFEAPSSCKDENAKPLNQAMMKRLRGHDRTDPTDADDPRVPILKTADLSRLPPATLMPAEIDALWAEGLAYGARLRKAGVPVRWPNSKG